RNNTPLSASNSKKLTTARAQLKSRITKHNKRATELLGRRSDIEEYQFVDDALFTAGVRLTDLMTEEEWDTGSSRASRDPSQRHPEFYGLDLASSRPMPLQSERESLAGAYEIALLISWMQHLLHEICMSLVVQVEIFRRTIRRTPGGKGLSQREKAVTSVNLREQYQSVRLYAQQYNVFYDKVKLMKAAPGVTQHPEYLAKQQRSFGRYRRLTKDDIKSDWKAYDTMGNGTFKLPWFWKLNARDPDISDENFIQDCESQVHTHPHKI
ncbi:unnamed protein product, partial [Peniophora sp. CBMAI 1063]